MAAPSPERRDRAIAAGATLLLALLTLTMLLLVTVGVPEARIPAAEDPEEQEIFFADIEYKEVVSDPTPQVDNQPASAAASDDGGTDLSDAGASDAAPQVVASKTPAPETQQVAKPEEQTAPPAPTKEEIEEQKRAAIRERLGRATGLKAQETQAAGAAKSGAATTGTNSRSDGLGLDGRKRLNKPDPGIKNAQGRVWVWIRVDASGAVVSASVQRSEGFGPRENEVREAILAASRALRYNEAPDKPSQSGTIVWNIK